MLHLEEGGDGHTAFDDERDVGGLVSDRNCIEMRARTERKRNRSVDRGTRRQFRGNVDQDVPEHGSFS